MDYSDDELIELYEERAAIREFDASDLAAEHGSPEQHRSWAEQQAYYDLRRLVGLSIPIPQYIRDLARKFGR